MGVRELCARHPWTRYVGGNQRNKFYINCDKDDLKATGVLSTNALRTILRAAKLHDVGPEIVVKISNQATILNEYNIGKRNQEIPGFIRYICYLSCESNIGPLTEFPAEICKKEEGGSRQQHILVMPYYKLGDMKLFPWNESNLDAFKSCMKQIVVSLYRAYQECHFVFNDLHFGNVLLDVTEEGYVRTVLMDFENSVLSPTANPLNHKFFWWDIMNICVRIKTDLRIEFANMNDTIDLLSKYAKESADPRAYTTILDHIDRWIFQEFRPQITQAIAYDPNVF